MKVPTDAIKTEDRLHYILAPPLETLLRSESLELPSPRLPIRNKGFPFIRIPFCHSGR